MVRLFNRFTAFWGVKFRDSFAGIESTEMMEVWAEELSGYSHAELNRGVAHCRTLKWPPTLPEFLTACRPPVDPTMALHEAGQNQRRREDGGNPDYSHPAIFWAAQEIGPWDMGNTPIRFMLPRWIAVLTKHIERGQWAAIPPPQLALEAPEGKPPSLEQLEALRELTSRLRGTLAPATKESK